MRSLSIAGFASAFAFAGVASAQPVIDGFLDTEFYGTALSVQNTNTGFGDSSLGQAEFANGSELDAFYARVEGDNLYGFIAGNLESNFNKLVIMFDSVDGGVNQLLNDPEDPLADLDFGIGGFNNGLRSLSGITFDAGFEADYMLALTHGTESIDDPGNPFAPSGWLLSAHFAELVPQSQNPAAGYAGGTSAPGAQGVEVNFVDASSADPITTPIEQFFITPSGGRAAADNSAFGIKAQINNENAFADDGDPENPVPTAGGVIGNGGSDIADPEFVALAGQVMTGAEFMIPLSTLGTSAGAGDIKIHAHVNGSEYSYLSNQVNGEGVLQGNIGGDGSGGFIGGDNPLSGVDFNTFAGDQFDVVANGGSSLIPGDANGDGFVDLIDLSILATNFDPAGSGFTVAEGDFNGDTVVDLIDLSILASNFAPAGVVPEPASAALLGLSALAFVRRR
ncbi:dockerin type I domain-containing protein [Mucisphaera sp.]|uniref:dockerin type I domain-containing protein n=1 Tax=Mucisphaera sp. TaxID=2913024 RepID=UPI003D1185A9